MPTSEIRQPICFIANLPITEYREALDLQSKLVAARKERILDTDIILLLEHFPVFTLGRRGGLENLTVSHDFLEKQGISVMQAERGGNITFHGPGQLIVYLIINLKQAGLKIVEYVEALEEIMILTAGEFGIKADRNSLNRGVWVGNKKLGSIGVAIRRNISFHGFALNVNLSLKPFEWINPCGLHGIGVTSLAQELSQEISVNQVRNRVKRNIESVFKISLREITDYSLKMKLS